MSIVAASPSAPAPRRFPYVVVRLMASVYSHCPVPPGLPADEILRRVRFFVTNQALPACVAWSATRVTYLYPDGRTTEQTQAPQGGLWMDVALFPLEPVPAPEVLARRATSPEQSTRAWLVGTWTVRTPNAAGQLTADAPQACLQLRDDQTYTWQPCPPWSTGTGAWDVQPGYDGRSLLVGFEDRHGLMMFHVLVRATLPGGRDEWDWQRWLREEALGEDWMMRATRSTWSA